jgi:hypothetical protein
MSEQNATNFSPLMENGKPDENPPRKLLPTLFIGLGGTGMEVILRIRRRILHASWGGGGAVRVSSLEEFPVAEFMHFDLDQGAVLEEGRATNNDSLANLVKLPPQDRVVSPLDLLKYSRNEDDLLKYSNISSWFPLNAEKVRTLGIDPSKGAGQMRPISRLYFFDNYRTTRDTITQKLDHLKANRQSRHQFDRLNLDVDSEKVRIVVVGSIAGGTGSGSFLDMGWLSRNLAYKAFGGAKYDVQLVLFTPRGYAKADKDQTEANGYAALMELETCMRQYPEFVGTWSNEEGRPVLDPTPYTDVYIVETANMGRHALEDVKEVYEMVADALFEDFANADFAAKKRSIAVNQQKHKGLPYHPPIPEGYGELKLRYFMGYSSFGQSILDTQHAQQLDEQEYRWCAAMLEAFFCVSGQDNSTLHATDKQRDDFLKQHLNLAQTTFDRFPDLGKTKELCDLCLPFVDNQLTDEILKDKHGGMEDAVQQKINAMIERIKMDEHNISEWPRLLRELIPALEQDVIRDQDTAAETSEDRVERRCVLILDDKKKIVSNKLYGYLDDQEYGGLEFVLTLIDLLKAAFDHPATGLAKVFTNNAQRYRAVRDALKTHQIEDSLSNISSAVSKSKWNPLDKPDITKAKTFLDHLKKDLGDYLRFHLRGIAAEKAAGVLTELSGYLGSRSGTDEKGNTLYTGLMEEFQSGRREVTSVANEIRKMTERIEDSGDKRHANYILLPVTDLDSVLPSGQKLREWANDAFKDFEGSKKIFPMLKTPTGKAKLVSKLRNKAVTERANLQLSGSGWKDPLVNKLNGMKEARQRVFSDLLCAAMPWIDASFTDVPLKAQKFKCLLGVGKVEEWEPFLEELKSSLPTYAGITAEQFQLCSTGIPGRAVCYCELSGFPLRVLRALENWRGSYRQVSKEWPVHTHIDPTLFVQPLVPTSQELKDRSSDFRLFLLAVMLRVLVRNPRKTIPPGQYLFDFGHGDRRNFGNERAFRTHGLPPEYRRKIEESVKEKLDECDVYHLLALSIMANIMGRVTYAPKMATDDNGKDYPVPGFSYAAALKLSEELLLTARQRGLLDDKIRIIENKLVDWDDLPGSLNHWTEEIPDSVADAYPWEVAEPNDQMPSRSKRRVKKEFFEIGWLNNVIEQPKSSESKHIIPGSAITPPPPPGVIPQAVTFFLLINSQQYGPYQVQQLREWINSGQVAASTLAWREGMAQWQALNTLSEFATPPPVSGMAPPPPPPPGTPPCPPVN